MRIIGLTGGIASGKSTVAGMLKDKGAYLIDADILAREVVEPDQPAWSEIVYWLGDSILLPDRSINRAELAGVVFADREKLDKLSSIIHPRVASRFQAVSEKITVSDLNAIIVYDVPLLIEVGMQGTVDILVLVYVPREVQVARLLERDGLSLVEANMRLDSQLSMEAKKRYADVIIDNSGKLSETAAQVDLFWDKFVHS